MEGKSESLGAWTRGSVCVCVRVSARARARMCVGVLEGLS